MGNAVLLEPAAVERVTSSSTADGYRAAFVARDEPGLAWRSTPGAASQWLVLDLGADVPLDMVVLTGLRGALASWNWSIDLATAAQGAFTGAYWSGASATLLAGSAMPTSGLGKALWLAPDDAPAAARYLRLTFSGLGLLPVEVSRVVAGARIQLARNFRFGAGFGVRPLGKVDFTRRGVFARQRGVKLRAVGISFGHIYRDEVEERVQPLLERNGNDETLVIVTDPDAHAQRQQRIFFGFLTGDLGTILARPGGYSCDFNLVALA